LATHVNVKVKTDRKCYFCEKRSSRTLPSRFIVELQSKYLCKSCLERRAKYGLTNYLQLLIDFDNLGNLHFKKYFDASKYKVIKINRKMPDCSELIASSDDICEAFGHFNMAIEHPDWRNEEIVIEWDLTEEIIVKKKFYKKFQQIDFTEMQVHPLFQSLKQLERDTLGLGLMLSMTGINVYYIESHASYFTGISRVVVRVGRPQNK